MGLLSKFRSRLGRFGSRASSLAGRYIQTARTSPRIRSVLGRGAKIGRRVGRIGLRTTGFAAKMTPIGRAVGLGFTALTIRSAFKRRKKRRDEKIQLATRVAQTSAPSAVAKAGGMGILKKIGGVAAVGAGAFLAEQLLEKAGVRGGAGLFGRRPKKRKSTRRKTRRKRKTRKVARHRHRIVRLPARTVVRTVRRKKRSSRRGKRVSFTTKDGRKVSFVAK